MTLLNRLQEAQNTYSEERFNNVWVVFSAIALPERDLMVGISPCLYGFTINYALEEATLLYTLRKQGFQKATALDMNISKIADSLYGYILF